MATSDPLNRDPITDEPGAHPVGTGLGAGGGAVAGAALGAVGGPLGVAAGAVVGAVLGGLAGHGAAEAISPTEGLAGASAPPADSVPSEPHEEKP